jgi:hypothetical protein
MQPATADRAEIRPHPHPPQRGTPRLTSLRGVAVVDALLHMIIAIQSPGAVEVAL